MYALLKVYAYRKRSDNNLLHTRSRDSTAEVVKIELRRSWLVISFPFPAILELPINPAPHPHPSELKNWPHGWSLANVSGTERQSFALVSKDFPTNWRQSKNKTDGLGGYALKINNFESWIWDKWGGLSMLCFQYYVLAFKIKRKYIV